MITIRDSYLKQTSELLMSGINPELKNAEYINCEFHANCHGPFVHCIFKNCDFTWKEGMIFTDCFFEGC